MAGSGLLLLVVVRLSFMQMLLPVLGIPASLRIMVNTLVLQQRLRRKYPYFLYSYGGVIALTLGTSYSYHYARTVLDLMLRGPVHPEGKVLFIGGGIANFTNVRLNPCQSIHFP